ncbi:MAG TPA: protein kinase [Caulifigura sp.]|nr:protein kinase [Caulifigura sp.]
MQRCRRAVRSLVRDLPSFDSVWIDVLLQHRLLTPYQARVLDSADPDRLCIAGQIVSVCLEENAWRAVYRAKSLESGEPCLVTLHGVHPEERTRVLQSIDRTIASLRGCSVEGLVAPRRAEVNEHELMVYSADARGTPLRDLLVRRGRFPEGAVLAIARNVVRILASLEERDVPHGDLRSRNVWLDDDGGVKVVHAGLLEAVMPTFLVSQEVPLEVCDGVAPELTKNGRRTGQSDQYALGCLLWQLAAGRPPFPTGDVHSKVTAHRTKAIADVRDYAPQVSEKLAGIIARLTQRSPSDRYASFRELALQIGAATKADSRVLRRFVRSFETEAPTQTARETGERSRQLPSALAAVVIGGATIWLFTSDPASLNGRASKQARATAPKLLPVNPNASPMETPAVNASPVVQTSGVRAVANSPRPLPNADASGVISLQAGVAYEARSLKAAGPIVLRGTEDGLARIRIGETGWDVAADTLSMVNVQVEAGAAVRVQTRSLEIHHSVLISPDDRAAVEWRPQDQAAVSPGVIQILNSQWIGGGVQCAIRPSLLKVVNTLKTGPGALLKLPATGRAHAATPVHVIHTTLRDSGPLLEWSSGPRAAGQRVEVLTKACVFSPASGSSLFALSGSLAPAGWESSITVSGLESLLLSGAKIVDLAPEKGKPRGQMDASKLEVDGLMTASIEFFGADTGDVAACGLRSTDASFSVDRPPGIEAGKVAQRVAAK